MAGEWIKRVEEEYGQDIYEILTMEAKTAKVNRKTKQMMADELGITKFELIYILRKFDIKLKQVMSEDGRERVTHSVRSRYEDKRVMVDGRMMSKWEALSLYKRGSQTVHRIMDEQGITFEQALKTPGISEEERISRSIAKRWSGKKSKRDTFFNPSSD